MAYSTLFSSTGSQLSARPNSLSSHISLRTHLLSLFRPTYPDAHDTPSRPRPFHWVRSRLSARSSGTDIELHERPLAEVSVPYAKGKRVCYFVLLRCSIPSNPSNSILHHLEKRFSKRETEANHEKATASSPRPANTTVAQQSSGAAQTQPSSQAHAAVSTSTTPTVVANTTSNTNPHATIKHAGRWARFWLFICCTSPEYTDGHH
jgi:hypothetical protein